MKNNNINIKAAEIMDETLVWYNDAYTKSTSEILKSLLSNYIEKLKIIKNFTLINYQYYDAQVENFQSLLNYSKINLNNSIKIANGSKDNGELKSINESTLKMGVGAVDMYNDQILYHETRFKKIKQETLDLIEFSISLNINEVTFNRIFDTGRVVLFSIPVLSGISTAANSAYDLYSIWSAPLKDMKNLDMFLKWIETRSLLLDKLKDQLYIRFL